MEHTWAKIKSWIQTYLGSWKTTNFGSGTYDNQLGLKISTGDSEHSLAEIKVADKFAICALKNSTLFKSHEITTPFGIAILYMEGFTAAYSKIVNNTAYTIIVQAMQITTNSEDALEMLLNKASLAYSESMTIINSGVTLLFWAPSN